MNAVPLDMLTLAKFSDLVNTQFRLFISPTVELPLVLAQASAGTSSRRAGQQYESFSLIFHGPEKPLLPQGMHTFGHDRLGRFDLFIVPIGKESGIVKYQAVFNRVVKTA